MPYLIVAVIILIIDRAVKYWVTAHVVLNSAPTTLIPHILGLTNIHNTGAAFSILPKAHWLFIVMSLLFTAVVIVLLYKNVIKGRLGRWTLVMVMAGGLGNCIDRILNGYVVDMFQFQFMQFAVFNVADIFITTCGVLFCIYLIFHKEQAIEATVEGTDAPARPLPKGKTAPAKNVDYISQIKRPVVNGHAGIESEFAARRCETPTAPKADGSSEDCSTPDFEDIFNKTPLVTPVPRAKPDLTVQKKPEPIRSGDTVTELFKKPDQPPKKNDTDFSLDDILAEFKDK